MYGSGVGGSSDSPHLQSEAVPLDQKRAGEEYCVEGAQVGAGLLGCFSDMDSEAHAARGQLAKADTASSEAVPYSPQSSFPG